MSERLKVFFMVLKKNSVVIAVFLIMVSVVMFLKFSTTKAYAMETVASVECTFGIFKQDNFIQSDHKQYFLGERELKFDNPTSEYQIDCESSICLEYNVKNISNQTITIFVSYNRNNSLNDLATYSFDGEETHPLDIMQFQIPAEEEKFFTVYLNIKDPTLDAYFDGSFNLSVSTLCGVIDG